MHSLCITANLSAAENLPNESDLRAQLDACTRPSGEKSFEAYTTGTHQYVKTLDAQAPCSSRIFVFPAKRIHDYRTKLVNSTGISMSICNVLTALIWTHITRARAEQLREKGYHETHVGIATSWRKRQDFLADQDRENYVGNMANYSTAKTNIDQLVAEER